MHSSLSNVQNVLKDSQFCANVNEGSITYIPNSFLYHLLQCFPKYWIIVGGFWGSSHRRFGLVDSQWRLELSSKLKAFNLWNCFSELFDKSKQSIWFRFEGILRERWFFDRSRNSSGLKFSIFGMISLLRLFLDKLREINSNRYWILVGISLVRELLERSMFLKNLST